MCSVAMWAKISLPGPKPMQGMPRIPITATPFVLNTQRPTSGASPNNCA